MGLESGSESAFVSVSKPFTLKVLHVTMTHTGYTEFCFWINNIFTMAKYIVNVWYILIISRIYNFEKSTIINIILHTTEWYSSFLTQVHLDWVGWEREGGCGVPAARVGSPGGFLHARLPHSAHVLGTPRDRDGIAAVYERNCAKEKPKRIKVDPHQTEANAKARSFQK